MRVSASFAMWSWSCTTVDGLCRLDPNTGNGDPSPSYTYCLNLAEDEVDAATGKSTVIRVLLGLYRPDGGVVLLFGRDPWHDPEVLHRRLAYVPGDVSLWPGMTGGEAIDLLGALRGGLDILRPVSSVSSHLGRN